MKGKSEAGFSYIDVIIAIVILMVGILAMLSGISAAIVHSAAQEQQLGAKQIITSAMESIRSAKETDLNRPPEQIRLGWPAVGNVGSNPDPGPDGIFETADDGPPQGIFVTGFQQVTTGAGPDEIVGTGDDNGQVVPSFRREIVITDVCDPDRPSYNCPTPGNNPVKMRTVTITITYFVGALQRQEVVRTVLADYAPPNDND